jgi:hypothetical protein
MVGLCPSKLKDYAEFGMEFRLKIICVILFSNFNYVNTTHYKETGLP